MTALVRLLKWVLALVLVVAVVLWFAARRGDRGFIEQEVTIGRPAAVVFRWISSEDLLRRWISELLELRKEEAAGQSASYRLVELIGGRPVAMRLQIARVVPNQELALQVSSADLANGGFSGEAHFKLIGTEEYTRLVFTSHAQFLSLGDRISEPILTFLADRKIKDDLARLKLLLEAEPANSPNPRTAPPPAKSTR
jgi:uncharacterized protein YndB with AHSA1/START domain